MQEGSKGLGLKEVGEVENQGRKRIYGRLEVGQTELTGRVKKRGSCGNEDK